MLRHRAGFAFFQGVREFSRFALEKTNCSRQQSRRSDSCARGTTTPLSPAAFKVKAARSLDSAPAITRRGRVPFF